MNQSNCSPLRNSRPVNVHIAGRATLWRKKSKENYNNRIRHKRGEHKTTFHFNALMSQQEVADVLGISRQAVHQVERTALHKLRLGLIAAVREINPELADNLIG